MKINRANIHKSWLATRVALFCGLVLTTAFFLSGCTSTDLQNPGLYPSGTNAPAASSHAEVITLREGDSVKVEFPDAPNLDTTQQIRRDGKISLQLVGEVQAAGLSPGQLQDDLIKLYASQITSKNITVSVQSSTFPVFVTGAVIKPGKILSDHPITALEAVMEAGGFDYAAANMTAVKVIRNENGVMKHYTLNLKSVLDGKSSSAFYLQPQDIVYVSQRFQLF